MMVHESFCLTSSSRFLANADVASASLGDQLALLDLHSSTYFSMNPVAAAIWERIGTPQSLADLAAAVRDTFEVGSADIEADISALLNELVRLKLVSIVEA